MLMSPVGLRPEKGCAGDAQKKNLKLNTGLLVREGAWHQQIRNCLKIIKERRKIGRGSQMGAWHHGKLADWYNFHFDLAFYEQYWWYNQLVSEYKPRAVSDP
jgi:hypothetical protein